MKILIENTVPLNNGDAALVFAIGDKLEEKGHDVSYSGTQHDLAKSLYPEKKWIRSVLEKKLVKVPILGFILMVILLLTNKEYRKYDVIISAPGGYVNSYYSSLKRKLQMMYLYKKVLRKKIFLYSQSIGPLNEKDEALLKYYFPKFDLIYVRDDISYKRMMDLNLESNILQTKDAAFLLERIKYESNESKKVAISVREWSFDNRNERIYTKLIINIVKLFVEKGYKITFLSTCQGIAEYRDDSMMAKFIFDKIPVNIKSSVEIDDNYYDLYMLRKKLTEYDFVVGTRLHMCILSWLSSVPALNISYEEKGKECYSYLDLEDYSIDYNFEGDIKPIINDFIQLNENIVFDNISKIYKESNGFLSLMNNKFK